MAISDNDACLSSVWEVITFSEADNFSLNTSSASYISINFHDSFTLWYDPARWKIPSNAAEGELYSKIYPECKIHFHGNGMGDQFEYNTKTLRIGNTEVVFSEWILKESGIRNTVAYHFGESNTGFNVEDGFGVHLSDGCLEEVHDILVQSEARGFSNSSDSLPVTTHITPNY